MAQSISDNIRTAAPKPLDDKWGVFEAFPIGWRPFNSITEFNSIIPLASRFNSQTFWVKSETNPDKADLYTLDKNKTPYKVQADVDLSDYYNKGEIDALNASMQLEITSLQEVTTDINEFVTDLSVDLVDLTEEFNVEKTNTAIEINNITESLDQEILDRQTAVTDETNARIGGDSTNTTAISNEELRATTQETVLNDKIDRSLSVWTDAILATTEGQINFTVPETIGSFLLQVNRSKGLTYTFTTGSASDTTGTVSFNSATGVVTFPTGFGLSLGEFIKVQYRRIGNPAFVPTGVVTTADLVPIKTYTDEISKRVFVSNEYDTDFLVVELDVEGYFLGGINSKGQPEYFSYPDGKIPQTAIDGLFSSLTDVAVTKEAIQNTDYYGTDEILILTDVERNILLKILSDGAFQPAKYADASIPKEALDFSIDAGYVWPRNAFEALGLLSKRRIDICEIMDSNGLHHGWGWNKGIEYALQTKGYAKYATSLVSASGGSTGLGVNTVDPPNTTGVRTPPTGFEQYTTLTNGLYLETQSIGTANGTTINGTANNTESPFQEIISTSAINRNSLLRYHVRYAEFANGGGSFRLGFRREESPFNVLASGEVINSVGDVDGIKTATVDLPPATRDYKVAAKIRVPSGTADIPKNWFIDQTIEDVNAVAGFRTSVIYSVGGQSLWDMANYLITEKTTQQLVNWFEQIRRLQLSKGQKPIVIIYINSGLNDQNELLSPSWGWRKSMLPTSTDAYIDNLEAIYKRLHDVWEYANWDTAELFFLIQPSHPIPTDNDKLVYYRKVVSAFMDGKNGVSFTDFNNYTSYENMLSLNYYQSGNTDFNHLTTEAYNDLATRTFNRIIEPTEE